MDEQLGEYRRQQRERAAKAAVLAKQAGAKGRYRYWASILAIVAVSAVWLLGARTRAEAGAGRGDRVAFPVAGVCPKPEGMGICVEECTGHADCASDGMLCCSNGCGHVCVRPVDPTAKMPEAKCMLMVVLRDKEAPEVKKELLEMVETPQSHQDLAGLGMIFLDYGTGHARACCGAYGALAGHASVKSVEFDGRAPDCANL